MARAREKDRTEHYRTLNINALVRDCGLLPGPPFDWYWCQQGEKVASIGITVESRHCLRLRYLTSSRGSESVRHDYPVQITWTPCHLGGERPWFLCPCCGRRVAKLYGSVLFACRHCLRLNYRSQQTSKRDRPCDRSWGLRRALGCDEGFLSLPAEFITKPKGMHWRTFNRKVEQLREVDARALAAAQTFIATLERKLNTARAALARKMGP